MEIYTVSLFGHRQLDDPFSIERKLETIVRNLLVDMMKDTQEKNNNRLFS